MICEVLLNRMIVSHVLSCESHLSCLPRYMTHAVLKRVKLVKSFAAA